METSNKIIAGLITLQKMQNPHYKNKSDAEILGQLLSVYFEWDGLEILKTTYAALEDSNFHTENVEIDKMIKKIENS